MKFFGAGGPPWHKIIIIKKQTTRIVCLQVLVTELWALSGTLYVTDKWRKSKFPSAQTLLFPPDLNCSCVSVSLTDHSLSLRGPYRDPADIVPGHSHCPPGTPAGSGRLRPPHRRHRGSSAPGRWSWSWSVGPWERGGGLLTLYPSGHLQVGRWLTGTQMALVPHSSNPAQGSRHTPSRHSWSKQ